MPNGSVIMAAPAHVSNPANSVCYYTGSITRVTADVMNLLKSVPGHKSVTACAPSIHFYFDMIGDQVTSVAARRPIDADLAVAKHIVQALHTSPMGFGLYLRCYHDARRRRSTLYGFHVTADLGFVHVLTEEPQPTDGINTREPGDKQAAPSPNAWTLF